MQLTLDQARFLRDYQVMNFEGELRATKACLLAMPTASLGYRPEAKSMTALELGWHIVYTDLWFINSLVKGEFGMDNQPRPAHIKTGADLVAWYEAELAKALPLVKAMSAEALVKPLNFFGMFSHPAVIYLDFLLSHCIHHRGQLSTYLRPMGGKVPGIYGPSADTPMPTPGA